MGSKRPIRGEDSMSFVGEYRKKIDHEIYKDEGAGSAISVKLYPNCSIVSELKDGYTVELRYHRDIREDSSVIYSGYLKKEDNMWWVKEKSREKLDHSGSKYNEYCDEFGIEDIPNPTEGEHIECRLHLLKKDIK